MARLIQDAKDLPERKTQIRGAKPPVHCFPHGELEHPEEADQFRELVRQLRRMQTGRPRPTQ